MPLDRHGHAVRLSPPPRSEGAELPLLDPRLLATLTRGIEQRRARNATCEYLILSQDDLAEFDPQRVLEVRTALIGSEPSSAGRSGFRRIVGIATEMSVGARWARAAVYITSAFVLGLIAGLL